MKGCLFVCTLAGVSEDNLPMFPGVSQNVGFTASAPIQPPTFPLSLDHSSLSLPQHYCTAELGRGGMLSDMNHVNMIQGRVAA